MDEFRSNSLDFYAFAFFNALIPVTPKNKHARELKLAFLDEFRSNSLDFDGFAFFKALIPVINLKS